MKPYLLAIIFITVFFNKALSQNCISKNAVLNISTRQNTYIYPFDIDNPNKGLGNTKMNFGFELRKYKEKTRIGEVCRDYFEFNSFNSQGLLFEGEESFWLTGSDIIYIYNLDNIFVSKEGYYTTYVTSNALENYLIRESTHTDDGIEISDYYYAIPMRKIQTSNTSSSAPTISPFVRDVIKDIIVDVASDFIKKKLFK